MILINGKLQDHTNSISVANRGLNYGDAVFETIRCVNSKVLFWEDHYFRLMASMRIIRMEIPMSFTLEFLENELLKVIEANALTQQTVRLKLLVYRGEGGRYLPTSKTVGYLITAETLENAFYTIRDTPYVVDLYKDFFISPSLLSTIKSTGRAINITGSIFAQENDLDNCILLNTDKKVIEFLNGNLFLVAGQTIKTPPTTDGCLNGILRKKLIEVIQNLPEFTIEEVSISPFELQQADELFLTNVITGIQPISKYRKKTYNSVTSRMLLQKLNVMIRLG